MIIEKVYSPVFDKEIQKDISNSPIWKECYHESEIADVKKPLIEYSIKFNGLTPIQVTKIKKQKRS